jgi:hypothetical protein
MLSASDATSVLSLTAKTALGARRILAALRALAHCGTLNLGAAGLVAAGDTAGHLTSNLSVTIRHFY